MARENASRTYNSIKTQWCIPKSGGTIEGSALIRGSRNDFCSVSKPISAVITISIIEG